MPKKLLKLICLRIIQTILQYGMIGWDGNTATIINVAEENNKTLLKKTIDNPNYYIKTSKY